MEAKGMRRERKGKGDEKREYVGMNVGIKEEEKGVKGKFQSFNELN